ncbi:MAG: S24/S26 family peptidase [Bacilli bacterium]|nr:S24/S26 family peptidase [Bacilli bacterium]
MNYVQNKIDRLEAGEIIVSREPGSSMEPILKSREPVILTPITIDEAIKYLKKGDIVFAKVHGNCYTHKVYEIDQTKGVKIGNNRGHENGWTRQVYAQAHIIPKERQTSKEDTAHYLEEFKQTWKGYGKEN